METREEAFDRIIAYEQDLHIKNQRRIKIGIRLLLIIPLIFLAIMFEMESNKVVFLTLWIVSLFVLAIYLIGIEFMDYELQMKLREFGIRDEDEEINGLIDDNMDMEKIIRVANAIQGSLSLEDKLASNVARLEDKSESKKDDYDEFDEEELEKEASKPQPRKRADTERISTNVNSEVKKKPRPRPEEGRRKPEKQIRKNPNKEIHKQAERKNDRKPDMQMHEDVMKDFINQVGVEAAEEELMASIKRYVAEVNKSDQPIVVEPRKTPKDYAEMRRKRAKERFDNEEE